MRRDLALTLRDYPAPKPFAGPLRCVKALSRLLPAMLVAGAVLGGWFAVAAQSDAPIASPAEARRALGEAQQQGADTWQRCGGRGSRAAHGTRRRAAQQRRVAT